MRSLVILVITSSRVHETGEGAMTESGSVRARLGKAVRRAGELVPGRKSREAALRCRASKSWPAALNNSLALSRPIHASTATREALLSGEGMSKFSRPQLPTTTSYG